MRGFLIHHCAQSPSTRSLHRPIRLFILRFFPASQTFPLCLLNHGYHQQTPLVTSIKFSEWFFFFLLFALLEDWFSALGNALCFHSFKGFFFFFLNPIDASAGGWVCCLCSPSPPLGALTALPPTSRGRLSSIWFVVICPPLYHCLRRSLLRPNNCDHSQRWQSWSSEHVPINNLSAGKSPPQIQVWCPWPVAVRKHPVVGYQERDLVSRCLTFSVKCSVCNALPLLSQKHLSKTIT